MRIISAVFLDTGTRYRNVNSRVTSVQSTLKSFHYMSIHAITLGRIYKSYTWYSNLASDFVSCEDQLGIFSPTDVNLLQGCLSILAPRSMSSGASGPFKACIDATCTTAWLSLTTCISHKQEVVPPKFLHAALPLSSYNSVAVECMVIHSYSRKWLTPKLTVNSCTGSHAHVQVASVSKAM